MGLNEIPLDRDEFIKVVENLLSGIDSDSKLVDILSKHDLFTVLQGNPTSLNRAANSYLFAEEKI